MKRNAHSSIILLLTLAGLMAGLGAYYYLFTQKPAEQPTTSGSITGTITLTYNLKNLNQVQDDINVFISEKSGVENNYFGASICQVEKDNCVWLISESGQTRIYGYRLTLEGGTDVIRPNQYYQVYVSTRHWTEKLGNVAGETSEKVRVEVPASGRATQDFSLTVEQY